MSFRSQTAVVSFKHRSSLTYSDLCVVSDSNLGPQIAGQGPCCCSANRTQVFVCCA